MAKKPATGDTLPVAAPLPGSIQSTIEIGGRPGAPNTGQVAQAPEVRTLRSDPRKDYLAAVNIGTTWYLNLARSLPPYIDSLEEKKGVDIYERMMATDPQIAANINVFKASVIENGPSFTAAISDTDNPDFQQAQFIKDWCAAIITDLGHSIDDILWNMTDAFIVGNKVAELVYEYSDQYWHLPAREDKHGKTLPIPTEAPAGVGGPQLILKDIKVKPRRSLGFLCDAYMNILGILGQIPGNFYPLMPGMVYASIDNIPNLLPAEKFMILAFRPHDSDPRGVSMLTPAYNAWYIKQQLWTEYSRFLSQMAGGMVLGQPSPSAVPLQIQNADGSPTGETATPAEAMLQVLQKAKNGAVLVTESGSTVDVKFPAGGGEAYLQAFTLLNLEMIKAILHVSLATTEGEHNSRAASEVHADVLSILIRQAKGAVERMLKDVLRRMVKYNYGEDAIRFTPNVSLGSVNTADMASLMAVIAQLVGSGYFTADQMPQLDELLKLPVRTPEAVEEQQQEAGTTGASQPEPGTGTASQTIQQGRNPRDMDHADPLRPEETPIPASDHTYLPARPAKGAA
jgi:hypothetical protein